LSCSGSLFVDALRAALSYSLVRTGRATAPEAPRQSLNVWAKFCYTTGGMSRLRPTLYLLLLLALGLLLAACGGDNPPLAVEEAAEIVCSDDCVAHGQCGRLLDDRRVVLANEGRPAVWAHNRFFLDETPVTVREVSQRELIAARDQVPLSSLEATPFPHIFYRVEGEGKNAWVSEWCVARP